MPSLGVDFTNQVLEGVNYVLVPPAVDEASIPLLMQKMEQWLGLGAEMHVLDFKSTVQLSHGFYIAVHSFTEKLKVRGLKSLSVNMNESLAKEVKRLGLEASFNRIQNFPGDLYKKKKLNESDVRRLLFRYLAQAAFSAVEVALKSTVSCDENYSAKPEEVPLEQFDMITVVNVHNDFLHAEFRLCSSASVLRKLAAAMLGDETQVDDELMESMALELLNMIYGHAKSNLNDKESFSLPSVIPRLLRKKEFHRIKRSPVPLLTIMPMVTPMGSFYVEVDFGKSKMS